MQSLISTIISSRTLRELKLLYRKADKKVKQKCCGILVFYVFTTENCTISFVFFNIRSVPICSLLVLINCIKKTKQKQNKHINPKTNRVTATYINVNGYILYAINFHFFGPGKELYMMYLQLIGTGVSCTALYFINILTNYC